MKTILFSTIILVFLLLTSCNDQTTQPDPIEPKDTIKYICPTCPEGIPFDSVEQCPLFYDPNHPLGMTQPTYEHDANGPSADGDLLSIGQTTIVNLKTLQRVIINPFEIFPKELDVVSATIRCFSPRDNSKILISLEANTINEKGKKSTESLFIL